MRDAISSGRRQRRASASINVPASGAVTPSLARPARSASESRSRGDVGALSRVKPHQRMVSIGATTAPGTATAAIPASAMPVGRSPASTSSQRRRRAIRVRASAPTCSIRVEALVATCATVGRVGICSARPRAQVATICSRRVISLVAMVPSRGAAGISSAVRRASTAPRQLSSQRASPSAIASRHWVERRLGNVHSASISRTATRRGVGPGSRQSRACRSFGSIGSNAASRMRRTTAEEAGAGAAAPRRGSPCRRSAASSTWSPPTTRTPSSEGRAARLAASSSAAASGPCDRRSARLPSPAGTKRRVRAMARSPLDLAGAGMISVIRTPAAASWVNTSRHEVGSAPIGDIAWTSSRSTRRPTSAWRTFVSRSGRPGSASAVAAQRAASRSLAASPRQTQSASVSRSRSRRSAVPSSSCSNDRRQYPSLRCSCGKRPAARSTSEA